MRRRRGREPRAEPSLVLDRAAGNEQTHVLSLHARRNRSLPSDVAAMLGYDEVLKELVLALGAALFLGNLLALFRRRTDAEKAKTRTVARTRPGSPVRGTGEPGNRDLAQAPIARTRRLHGDRARRHDLGPRLDFQLSQASTDSGMHGRAAIGPGAGRFELRGQPEQHVFAAVRARRVGRRSAGRRRSSAAAARSRVARSGRTAR